MIVLFSKITANECIEERYNPHVKLKIRQLQRATTSATAELLFFGCVNWLPSSANKMLQNVVVTVTDVQFAAPDDLITSRIGCDSFTGDESTQNRMPDAPVAVWSGTNI